MKGKRRIQSVVILLFFLYFVMSSGFKEEDGEPIVPQMEVVREAIRDYIAETGFFLTYNGQESDIFISLTECNCIYRRGETSVYAYNAYQKVDDLGIEDDYHSIHVLYILSPQGSLQVFPVDGYLVDENQELEIMEIEKEGKFDHVMLLSLNQSSQPLSQQQKELFNLKEAEERMQQIYSFTEREDLFFDVILKASGMEEIVCGYVSAYNWKEKDTFYMDWEINIATGEMTAVPHIQKVYDPEKDEEIFAACKEAYDRIEAGDLSKIIVYDEVDKESLKKENEPWWYRQDVNGDGLPELIMFAKRGGEGKNISRTPIENIFTWRKDGWVEQVDIDQVDISAFSFPGANGTLVYDVCHYGVTATGVFKQYVFDEHWNRKTLLVLCLEGFDEEETYAEYDGGEYLKELKEAYPESFGKSGGGVYAYILREKTAEELVADPEGEEWTKEYISMEEFYRLYEEMTGFDFRSENSDWEWMNK